MTLLLSFAVLSIGISFLCSLWEATLLSIPSTYIQILTQKEHPLAKSLAALKKKVDEPLIAILTLNTLAHTVGAIGVGATAEVAFGDGNGVVAIVSGIMTLLILVVSEIIPKTIGARFWRPLLPFVVRSLQLILWPMRKLGILWLLQLTTRVIGGKGHQTSFSREEFEVITELASNAGALEDREAAFIQSLLGFETVQARHVMTPRSVVHFGKVEETVAEFLEDHQQDRFSRIPLLDEEDVVGFILRDELLEHQLEGKGNKKLIDLKRSLIMISDTDKLLQTFETLLEERTHMAAVLDEYGLCCGIVTLEDVVETFFGIEILDETDEVTDLQELARNRWTERAKRLGLVKNGDEDPLSKEED